MSGEGRYEEDTAGSEAIHDTDPGARLMDAGVSAVDPGSGSAEPDVNPDPDAAARGALARARDAARAKGVRTSKPGGRRRQDGTYLPSNRTSARDPAPMADAVHTLAQQLGWNQPLSIGGVIGRWREVVGDQIADHCTPETFTDGALVVRANSTAWATQIRLLLPQLERRLAEDVGEGVVTSIQVLGPGGPSWRKGLRRVSDGRGPRDTYG